jgi:protein TonB
MAAYAPDSQFFSRRLLVLGIIVAFHVLLIWALANGLAHHLVELIAPPLQTQIIDEVKKQDTPPPPPPPTLERPPVEIPPTDIAIDVPVETNTTALSNVSDKPQPVARPAPPPPPQIPGTTPKAGRGFPSSEDYYPTASKRLGEEGSPVVRICVDPKGKVVGEPTIVTPSQFPRLDEGALKLAKAASGHFTPGTQNGQPVEMCFPLKITFKITG